MATSSLKKSFVISSKKEADAFVKMFSDSLKNPPKPLNEVECSTISREQMTKIINARLDGKKITTKYNESLNCSQ